MSNGSNVYKRNLFLAYENRCDSWWAELQVVIGGPSALRFFPLPANLKLQVAFRGNHTGGHCTMRLL